VSKRLDATRPAPPGSTRLHDPARRPSASCAPRTPPLPRLLAWRPIVMTVEYSDRDFDERRSGLPTRGEKLRPAAVGGAGGPQWASASSISADCLLRAA
jgi:hypothetical protein